MVLDKLHFPRVLEDNLVENIPNQMIYILIGLVVFYVSVTLMNAQSSHIFALIVAGFIIYILKEKVDKDTQSFNKTIDYKLKELGDPEHFYMDVNFINLFYSILHWKKVNPGNFNEALKACSNVLQIELDSEKGLQRCVDNYEIAMEQSKICLNMIHGFIYSITNKLLIKKLMNVLERLQQLLTRHMLKIQGNCEKTEASKENVDVNTRYIQDTDGPKPNDSSFSNFDFY
jgi:hypothetical protein